MKNLPNSPGLKALGYVRATITNANPPHLYLPFNSDEVTHGDFPAYRDRFYASESDQNGVVVRSLIMASRTKLSDGEDQSVTTGNDFVVTYATDNVVYGADDGQTFNLTVRNNGNHFAGNFSKFQFTSSADSDRKITFDCDVDFDIDTRPRA